MFEQLYANHDRQQMRRLLIEIWKSTLYHLCSVFQAVY
jgi:hypothetical protein